jgi:predicted amidohydrolase
MRRLVLVPLIFLSLLPLAARGPAEKKQSPVLPSTLHVAAVQMRSTRDLSANVEHTIDLLRRCRSQGVEVAVFPECSLSGYFDDAILRLTAEQLVDAEKKIADACRELNINAIIGSPVRDGDKLYNSALVISANGKVIERYHKVQLAESWPTPGDHLSTFPIAGVPCSNIICHDERYPELVRLPVLAGARVVFYLSHESPLQQEHKLAPYRAQIQARAAENGVFVVHANAPANKDATGSHGQSRIIDPNGNLIGEASMFQEEVVVAKLDLKKATAGNALRSISRGPLRDWWKEGLKQVRRID